MVDRSSLTDEVEEAKARLADAAPVFIGGGEITMDRQIAIAMGRAIETLLTALQAKEDESAALREERQIVISRIPMSYLQMHDVSGATGPTAGLDLTAAMKSYADDRWKLIDRVTECVSRGDTLQSALEAAQARAEKAEASLVELAGLSQSQPGVSAVQQPASPSAQHSGGWFKLDQDPKAGRKFIALYNDGSGAAMFWRHPDGVIDQDGNEGGWPLKGYDRWAYLPDDLEFWCEICPEDPLTLHLHAEDADPSGPQGTDAALSAPDDPLPPSGVRDETDTLSRGSET